MNEQTMETTAAEEINFDDFLAADAEDGGYHADGDGTEAEVPATPENEAEGTEKPTDGESEYGGKKPESEEKTDSKPTQKPTEENSEQMFTIKVNKEERTVGREEMISLAQKGSDYDRVKEQLTESRQTVTKLQEHFAQQQEVMDLINMMAGKGGQTPAQMVENLYISMQKAQGVNEDAAREALRADKLQRRITKMETEKEQKQSAEKDQAARARAEVEEFRKQFPDVELTEEVLKPLIGDVQAGMSMVDAYRKAESAKQAARIAELEAQLAAEKQNKANKKASPGSQSDSGGAKTRNMYDDFMEAFK